MSTQRRFAEGTTVAVEQPEGPVGILMDFPRGNQIEIRSRKKLTREEFGRFMEIVELWRTMFFDDAPLALPAPEEHATP